MVWIQFALAIADPTQGMIGVDDFPKFLLQSGKSYHIPTRTLVGPDGKPTWCEVERPSDQRRIDTYTCDILVKRARFTPFKWIDGSPTLGLFRQTISWAFELPKGPSSDLDIIVNKLPADVKSPVQVYLNVAVDTDASVVSCSSAPTNSAPIDRTENPTLVRLACSELIKSAKFFVPKDRSGQPLRTIQNYTVLFADRRLR